MKRRNAADRGFTLTELLVCVAVMGIVATSLAAGIIVIIRNMGTTSQRIAATTDAQNLVTWLPVDVSSSPAANLKTDPSLASGCASASPGTNILLLGWKETVNGTTLNYIANYRSVPDGATMRLQRFSCSGESTMSAAFVQNVSNPLQPLPPGWAPGQAPVAVSVSGNIVRFTLTQADGRINSVDSAQKNPDATLPASPTTIVPSGTTTIVAPTTTAAPTTTVAPATTVVGETTTTVAATTSTVAATTTTTTIPCTVPTLTVSDTTPATHSKAPNLLQQDVTVTISKNGSCQLLQLQYDTGGSQGLLYQTFPTTSPLTVTLRGFTSGGTEVWTAGAHVLRIIDNNKNVLKTITITVS